MFVFVLVPVFVKEELAFHETGTDMSTSTTNAIAYGSDQKNAGSQQKEKVVKPHGQLVPVSFTYYYASTPGLSTS